MSNNKFDISEIKNIITGFLTGDITDTEREELNQWLRADSANADFFNEMANVWRISALADKGSDVDLAGYWTRLESRIKSDKRSIPFRNITVKITGIAAAVLFAFIAGGMLGWLLLKNGGNAGEVHMCQVVTPNGTRSELLLADGSMVWLNAGSTISYPSDFTGDTREVELTGEAFFQVKSDKSRPFIVKSSGLQIKALGTSFNVKAYPGDTELAATLVEGKIVIEGKSKEEGRFSYTLEPRQSMVFVTSSGSEASDTGERVRPLSVSKEAKGDKPAISRVQLASNVNTVLYTSWKDKRWVIEQESLTDLLMQLQRRYNVEIICRPEELQGYSFSGTIENETFEQVLNILQLSAPIKYEFGKGKVVLDIDKDAIDKFRMIDSDEKDN